MVGSTLRVVAKYFDYMNRPPTLNDRFLFFWTDRSATEVDYTSNHRLHSRSRPRQPFVINLIASFITTQPRLSQTKCLLLLLSFSAPLASSPTSSSPSSSPFTSSRLCWIRRPKHSSPSSARPHLPSLPLQTARVPRRVVEIVALTMSAHHHPLLPPCHPFRRKPSPLSATLRQQKPWQPQAMQHACRLVDPRPRYSGSPVCQASCVLTKLPKRSARKLVSLPPLLLSIDRWPRGLWPRR